MGSVIDFTNGINHYRKLADARSQKEDFEGALAFLFSAKSIEDNYQVIMDIADTYANMGALELSNRYWYKYMDKAPKEKVSVAYEELAINYFYLDNYWASSYYFHQKLTTDGHIMKEGLDQEIIDFFSGEEMKRDAYRIVYPPERANYNLEIKRAKHALAIGAFNEAKESLLKIPLTRRTEEISGELAIACFMSDDLSGAEEVCRDSLTRHGENVTAYCNLSTIYDMKEDADNAEFYYAKALKNRKGEKGEEFKLATCAIERLDHDTALYCLEKILEDRPYELVMRFFYGLCFMNLGRYERAKEELKKTFRMNPSDDIVRFYLGLSQKLIDGDSSAKSLLPIEYVKELPKPIVKEYSEQIKKLVESPLKIEKAVKKQDVKSKLEWGLKYREGQTSRDSAFVLSSAYTPYSRDLFLSLLIDPDIKEEVKRVIIYILAVKGHRKPFGLVSGAFYSKIKLKRVKCEKSADGGMFLSAYALCVARVAFWEAENIDKVAKATDKVYEGLKDIISLQDVTNDELAGVILSECAFKWCKNDKDILKLFDIEQYKLEKLRALLKGGQNDKNYRR